MDMAKSVKFTALLDEKTYEKLREEGYKRRISISKIIRIALKNLFLSSNLEEIINKYKDDE